MNDSNHLNHPAAGGVARSPSLFRQIIAGLLIVAAMFAAAAAISDRVNEQPVRESQESVDVFFPV
jgi:hypothetical protein